MIHEHYLLSDFQRGVHESILSTVSLHNREKVLIN